METNLMQAIEILQKYDQNIYVKLKIMTSKAQKECKPHAAERKLELEWGQPNQLNLFNDNLGSRC